LHNGCQNCTIPLLNYLPFAGAQNIFMTQNNNTNYKHNDSPTLKKKNQEASVKSVLGNTRGYALVKQNESCRSEKVALKYKDYIKQKICRDCTFLGGKRGIEKEMQNL